jgi:hypothetical protein
VPDTVKTAQKPATKQAAASKKAALAPQTKELQKNNAKLDDLIKELKIDTAKAKKK